MLFQNLLDINVGFEVARTDAIGSKPEFLIEDCISLVSSVHVLVDHGHRHDEVDVKMVDDVDEQAKGDDETRVFEVCQLNVHGSELNAPSDT